MKLAFLLASLFTVVFGWIKQSALISILGAIIFCTILLVGLIQLIRISWQFRNNKLKNSEFEKEKTVIEKVTSFIEVLMIIGGLIVMVFGVESMIIAGSIIWIGTVIIYILSGVISGLITGVPLKMGYGGWYIARTKKRN